MPLPTPLNTPLVTLFTLGICRNPVRHQPESCFPSIGNRVHDGSEYAFNIALGDGLVNLCSNALLIKLVLSFGISPSSSNFVILRATPLRDIIHHCDLIASPSPCFGDSAFLTAFHPRVSSSKKCIARSPVDNHRAEYCIRSS